MFEFLGSNTTAPPTNTVLVLAALSASKNVDNLLQKYGADEPGIVRFSMLWKDGSKRELYMFLGRHVWLYDPTSNERFDTEAENNGIVNVKSNPARVLAPLEGVEAGYALGPVLGAKILSNLQFALLSTAIKAAKRQAGDEAERREAFRRIVAMPSADERLVRRIAALLYKRKPLPAPANMRGFASLPVD